MIRLTLLAAVFCLCACDDPTPPSARQPVPPASTSDARLQMPLDTPQEVAIAPSPPVKKTAAPQLEPAQPEVAATPNVADEPESAVSNAPADQQVPADPPKVPEIVEEGDTFMRRVAAAYHASLERNVRGMVHEKGAVGVLADPPVTFEVRQVISPTRMLVELIGFNGYRKDYLVDGIDTSGIVDDALVKLSGELFVYLGTETFTTVLGGTRTVHHVHWVDAEQVKRVADELAQENAEADRRFQAALREQIRAAQLDKTKARNVLDEYNRVNLKIAQYVTVRDKLKLYEAIKDTSDAARRDYETYAAALDQLGHVSKADIEAYKEGLAVRKQKLQEAAAHVLELRRQQ